MNLQKTEIRELQLTDSSNRVKKGKACYSVKGFCEGAKRGDLILQLDRNGYIVNEYFCTTNNERVHKIDMHLIKEEALAAIESAKTTEFYIYRNLNE